MIPPLAYRPAVDYNRNRRTLIAQHEVAGLLRELGADAGFVRLPVDRTELSAIPLYVETTVVVAVRRGSGRRPG